MTLFYERLSQREVINHKQIKELKETINGQYPIATSKQKANYLAIMIHDLIDQSLPNYSTHTKKNIRKELLQRKLSANSLIINANDIIESSVELVSIEELEKELPLWVKGTLEVEDHSIETYISNLLNTRKKVESEVATAISGQAFEISETIPNMDNKDVTYQPNRYYLLAAIVSFLMLIPILQTINLFTENPKDRAVETEQIENHAKMPNELPTYLQYQSVDKEKLRAWLNERNSMLADEPYFSAIIGVANEYNINPRLLFAITGQEQGFVPRSNKNAPEIVNNPFNVFHSWEDFNTNIVNSSEIAARTIINLSKNCPDDVHPIKWINRKYAEDPNWWVGVSSIFKQLDKDV